MDIYFGTETVTLSQVSGKTLPCTNDSISNPVTNSHLQAAKKRLASLSELGEEYKKVFVPAIPAAELELRCVCVFLCVCVIHFHYSSPVKEADVSLLPDQLQTPLLKSADGTILAIRRFVLVKKKTP